MSEIGTRPARNGLATIEASDSLARVGVGAAPTEELDFGRIYQTVRRHWLIAVTTAVLLLSASATAIWMLPRTFEAEALVVVGGDRASNLTRVDTKRDPDEVAAPDIEAVQTQVEILRSRELAAHVIEDLHLSQLPEFEHGAAGPQAMLSALAGWLGMSWPTPTPSFQSKATDAAAPQDGDTPAPSPIIDAFMSRLTVAVRPNSRIISVKFEARDPSLAARVTNRLAEEYISDQLDRRSNAAKSALRWLDDKVAELRNRITELDNATESFRAQSGLYKGLDPVSRRIVDVSSELATTALARKEIEARLAQLSVPAAGDSARFGAKDVLNSPVMVNLREKEGELEGELEKLSSTLGPSHPKLIQLKSQIAGIRLQMRAEASKAAAALQAELRVTTAKEDALRQDLASLKGEMAGSVAAETKVKSLQQDADVNRGVLEAFLVRLREASDLADKSIQRANAEIISHADVPQSPSKPRTKLLLMLATIASGAAGVGAAVSRERSDKTFRSGEQVEAETGASILGLVPVADRGSAPHLQMAGPSSGSYGEAIKALYMTLLLPRRLRMLVVTSAHPREGKTTLAISLALMAAKAGRRVLLVDADLCRRGASELCGYADHPGVGELIAGEKPFADVVVTDDRTGIDFLPAGADGSARDARKSMEAVAKLLDRLSGQYDLIIVDSPPVLAVSDAMALSAEADATVFAIRWGATPRDATRLGMKRLAASGGALTGAVLTMVDPREHSRRGYSDSSYYAKALRQYQV